jgi:predicted nucleotidyltransferase
LLLPGKNALETAVALGEFGNPFKGERFMQREKVRWLFEQLNEHGIRYALVGGLAVAHYAIPRMTQDVDILVLQEDAGKLLQLLRPYYARGTAQVMFFLIDETRLDVLIATLRYQRAAVLNAQEGTYEGVPVKVINPRDLVLMKLLAAWERPSEVDREQDRVDIMRILSAFGHQLTPDDIAYIAERLRELCFLPEEFARWRERMEWLNQTLQRLNLAHLQYPLP